MITWRSGNVVSLGAAWAGARECQVATEDGSVRALVYLDLVGEPTVGERVLLNVTAQTLGLGTGGYALVVARPEALRGDREGPGHLVKARYTPLQTIVLGVDEQDSPHHVLLREADDLSGLPVVVADLHSALPAVVGGARWAAARAGRQEPRVVHVMTDGGALPAAFSRTVAGLREAGWLAACITVGQAYGGDLEAVTVHSGLLAARLVAEADIAVVVQGPGNLGTGTRWGFSGAAAGEAVNAAGVLGGRPVAALRVSGADPRTRHRGISHHCLTAYGRAALVPADVVVPVGPSGDPDRDRLRSAVRAQATQLCAPNGRHRLVEVAAGPDLEAALAEVPVELMTMGRSLAVDPEPFVAAAVAGVHAASLLP